MKTKTSELEGAALDWAVAKCEGVDAAFLAKRREYPSLTSGYSTDWAKGGPIVEREKLLVTYAPDMNYEPWVCDDYAGLVCSGMYWGTTPLIAAMRCYVASELGDEVDVPEELLNVPTT